MSCGLLTYWYVMWTVTYWYVMRTVTYYWYVMWTVTYWYVMWTVTYWYVVLCGTTGLSSFCGNLVNATISNQASPTALFQKVPFHLKLSDLSILFHRITPFRYTSKYYPELSSSAAHHRCYC